MNHNRQLSNQIERQNRGWGDNCEQREAKRWGGDFCEQWGKIGGDSVNMERQRGGGFDLCEQREAKTGGGDRFL
jgi:hypothetical protein